MVFVKSGFDGLMGPAFLIEGSATTLLLGYAMADRDGP
jgi:hypothetical protein